MPRPPKYPPVQRGQRYGRRTVIRESSRGPKGHERWMCRCDCGSELITLTTVLNRIASGINGPGCSKCAKRVES